MAARLERILAGRAPEQGDTLLDDLEDDEIRIEAEAEEAAAIDLKLVEKELERVRSFISLAQLSAATARLTSFWM